MQIGIVNINNKLIKVKYKFINVNTIYCISELGNLFYTHYKSLVK